MIECVETWAYPRLRSRPPLRDLADVPGETASNAAGHDR